MNLGNIKMFTDIASAYNAKVEYEDFRTPLEECIIPDANLDRLMGEAFDVCADVDIYELALNAQQPKLS